MKLWNTWAFFSVHCRSIEHFIPVSGVGTKCKLSFFSSTKIYLVQHINLSGCDLWGNHWYTEYLNANFLVHISYPVNGRRMTSSLGLLGLDPWSPSPPQAESARLVRFASPGCSTQGLSSLSNDSAMGTRVLQGSWLELGGTSTRSNCSALSRRLLSKPEGDVSRYLLSHNLNFWVSIWSISK